MSSTRSASNSASMSSRVHSDHSNNGGGHDSAPNAEILSILRTIQGNQKKQDDRMAEIENMCCDYQYQDDYDDYGDFNDDPGTSGEHETASKKRTSEDVDTCTDNRYVNAGKKLKVKETCDKPIDDELANLVTDWFREGIEEERYGELLKVINRPENCPALVTVKTNQMVWDFLSPMTKSSDKKMQNIQTSLVKGACALTKLTYLLGKCDNPEILDLLGNAMESLALLGHANRQLCMLRRELMKPDMKGEYTHLCSHNLKYTDYLFGDDVPKTVKDITDCSKISNKIGLGFRGGFRGRSTRGRARGRFVRGAARGHGPYSSSSAYSSDAKNYQQRGLQSRLQK
eukprot:XP_019919098.1 PREDICTED: uncharacterized protein LOC109617440 [Crassostrea gigas]